jgi:hypothetical protein
MDEVEIQQKRRQQDEESTRASGYLIGLIRFIIAAWRC